MRHQVERAIELGRRHARPRLPGLLRQQRIVHDARRVNDALQRWHCSEGVRERRGVFGAAHVRTMNGDAGARLLERVNRLARRIGETVAAHEDQ